MPADRPGVPESDPSSLDEDDASSRRTSVVARVLPRSVALGGLSVDLHAPDTVVVGDPARFHVVVRNRLPVPVSVSTPTSRLWGWQVDGVPEADRRDVHPPETERPVYFGRRERRVFSATWDGRIREAGPEGDVWRPASGAVTLTGYLAVADFRARGLYAEREVMVVE